MLQLRFYRAFCLRLSVTHDLSRLLLLLVGRWTGVLLEDFAQLSKLKGIVGDECKNMIYRAKRQSRGLTSCGFFRQTNLTSSARMPVRPACLYTCGK